MGYDFETMLADDLEAVLVAALAPAAGLILPKTPLVYEPERWNVPDLVEKFNCYSYALDTQGYGWLPLFGGLARTRQIIKYPMTEEFRQRAAPSSLSELWLKLDGFKQIYKHQYGPHEKHIIAYDSRDEHFFRLDAAGIWSHKRGSNIATNRDDSGAVITDLENGSFKVRGKKGYGGTDANIRYYIVPDEGVKILFESVRATLVPKMILSDCIQPVPAPSFDWTTKSREEVRNFVTEQKRKSDVMIHRNSMQMIPYELGGR